MIQRLHTNTATARYTKWGSNPGGGEIFRTSPDRPWGPPSLMYSEYRVFPGVKSGRGVTLTPHHLLVPWSRKSRAIPLIPLWAVRPVQSLSACTVQLYLYSPSGPYGMYRVSVPVQGCTLPYFCLTVSIKPHLKWFIIISKANFSWSTTTSSYFTPWSSVLPENFTVPQLDKNPPPPLPHKVEDPMLSQRRTFHAVPSHVIKTHFNIIPSSMPRYSKLSLSLRFHHEKPFVDFSPSPIVPYAPHISFSLIRSP